MARAARYCMAPPGVSGAARAIACASGSLGATGLPGYNYAHAWRVQRLLVIVIARSDMLDPPLTHPLRETHEMVAATLKQGFGRGLVKFGRRIRKPLDRVLTRYSRVGNPPVFERGTFAWADELEANWQAIRDEALAVMANDANTPPLRELSPDHRGIARDNHWRCFFIWGYGKRVARNADLCPQTTRAVERIPGLLSAFYSIHTPGTLVPEHRGVSKTIVNCHLPLDVPAGAEQCGIEIDGRTHGWTEGETLIFDDTYRHSAWNHTQCPRVILLVQFQRPLKFPGSLLGGAFLGLLRRSPFVRDVHEALEQEQHGADRS